MIRWLLLALVTSAAAVQVLRTGAWARNVSGANPSEVQVCTNQYTRSGFLFRPVIVDQTGMVQSAILTLTGTGNTSFKIAFEDRSNPPSLYSCSDLTSRSVKSASTTTGYFIGKGDFNVTAGVRQVVGDNWYSGNAMAAIVSVLGGSGSLAVQATLQINFTLGPANATLSSNTAVVALTGNFSSGLNVASTNTNLSIGVPNMKMVLSPTMPVNVTVTGSISNGATSVDCAGPPTTITSNATIQFICQLQCAPGSNYRLVLKYCWVIPDVQVSANLAITYSLNGSECWNQTLNGTINFPSPVLLSGTLLPDDGRPYPDGGGQIGSNATSQVLNSRDLFNALVGVQHFCPGPWVSLWLTTSSGQIPCTIQAGRDVLPPVGAADDYYTIQFIVPACNQTFCPEKNATFLTMNYANSSLTTADSLLYPALPVILAVSGCEDDPPRTKNCPTTGGTRLSITMSQPVGFSGVSVLVIAPCTSVITNLSTIYCTLPKGAGAFQPLFVFSAGLVSSPVYLVSYSPPAITSLSGGVGCVADMEGPLGGGGGTPAAAVKLCDRNGSSSVLMTIVGTNFGDVEVIPSLTLQGVTIPVIKSTISPHTQLNFSLPPGFGALVPLVLTVGLQSTVAYVSYEACLLGQDATCNPCAVGRYGVVPPACVLCPPGRSQALIGQSECELCPKGTYQQAPGQHSCIRCPEKMTSLGVGSDDSQLCSSCPVTHYLAVEGMDNVCAPCAPNSIPDVDSCGCLSGYFDDRLFFLNSNGSNGNGGNGGGGLNCQPCPAGANCKETGTRSATMGPLPGWWKSSSGTFVQCLEAINCLGVQWGSAVQINSSSMCLEHRSGVLCAECDPGFQPSSLKGGACIPCDSSALAWLWVSLILVLVVIGMLGVGFCVHQRRQTRRVKEQEGEKLRRSMTPASSGSSTSLVFATAGGTGGEGEDASSVGRTRHYRSETVVVPPSTPLKRKKDANTLISTGKIAVGFLQILSSMVSINVALPSTFMQVMRAFAFLNFDFMPWASIRCVFHIDFYTRIYVGCLYPFIIVLLLIVCVAIPIALRNKRDYQDEELFREHRSQYVNKAITLVLFCIFLLYPWITLQLLQFGICLHLDGKYYLVADMGQLCFEGEWMSHLGAVIALFMLLSVGIPLVLGMFLYRARYSLRSKQTRERLGFLYLAYSSECWWFEMVEMSTRVILISIVRFFDSNLHAPLRMAVCFCYLVAVLFKMPYVHDSLDALALFCMVELMLTSCLAHLLPSAGQWQGTYIDDLLSAVLLTVAFVLFLFFMLQMVKASRWLAYHPLVQKLIRKEPAIRMRIATRFGSMFEAELINANSESSPPLDPSDPSVDPSVDPSSSPPTELLPPLDTATDSSKPVKPRRNH